MSHKGLKRQGSLYVLAAIGVAAATLVVLPWLWPQDEDPVTRTCTETSLNFTEDFGTLTYKDTGQSSVAGWTETIHGPITLPGLGSKFSVGSADSMGGYIYASASGDFTGDGYPDLIGFDITGQASDPRTSPYSRLVLVRNQYATDPDNPLVVDWTEVYDSFGTRYTGPAAITVGDYNGDGLLDFFFMRNQTDQFGYTDFLAKMYINTGTATNPNFSASSASNLDFSSLLRVTISRTTYYVYNYWLANHIESVDYDRDGDTDLLFISQDKVFVLQQGGGSWRTAKFTLSELSYGGSTGRLTYGTGVPGGSAIAAADFDGDTDIDIVCGSVGTASYLVLYRNDGHQNFTRSTIAIPNPTCVGVVAIMANDFNNDGRPDLFVATDAAYRRSLGMTAEGKVWFMRNETIGGTMGWTFACLNSCGTPTAAGDIDVSTMLDFDADGDMDIIISDANHSGDYYLIENDLAGYFAIYGQGVSLNMAGSLLDPTLHAITQVRITNLLQGIRGSDPTGLTATIYFSNSGGRVWEFYQRFEGDEIANAANLDWYEFKQFGADLRWKVVFTAPEDVVYDIYDQYIPHASYESPYIDELEFEVIYINRLEYSRASAAATVVTDEGTPKKLVIGASFIFPGDEGQLRAYDLTNVSIAAGTASVLSTITTSNLESATGRNMAVAGAEIFWDAGRLLADRASSSRLIYTAVRADGELANPLARTDFAAANVDALAGFLGDVQNENAELIEFIRGTGRSWKLGDINRSTPVIVGPPARDAGYMGEGYAEFKETHRDRAKVIYVGANDGMLHCFDALTGEEIWGFIPYNLLPKLKDMYQVDPANSARYFLPSQTGYVDATPAVADVRYNGAWHTVLICGQGPGKGAALGGGLNYYWALDVTVPDNPQPLWEITHRDSTSGELTMGETRSTPAVGRINDGGTARWVAFTGSGYDNDGSATVTCGTYLYVIDVETGAFLAAWPADPDVDTSAFSGAKEPNRYTNISPAIVASPTTIDNTNDGYIDFVYAADLDGRVYRLDARERDIAAWTFTSIYEDYLNYPIAAKPAIWLNPYEASPIPPRIYVGTGGHDRNLGDYNPNTDELAARTFSFVGLIDNGTDTASVEWYMGDPALLGGLPTTRDTGDLGAGYKVWADPVVADMILYFSTLSGSIESANPCANLAGGGGQLYARYIRQSSAIPVGGTAFRATEGTPPEYLQLISKARQAVTVGEAGYDETARVSRREIYVQQYDSTIQQLVQPIGSLLRVRSWREVYRVIWD